MAQRIRSVLAVSLMAWLMSTGSGCASAPGPSSFKVNNEQYAAVFDAARTELTRQGFELERIDARAGVIETRPKETAGLATPWDTEQSSLRQEWEDFANDQRRVVRVTFDESENARDVRVEVTLYRLRVPGRRIETEAIRLSTRSVDETAGAQAGMFLTPIGRDVHLESRIATRLQAQLSN